MSESYANKENAIKIDSVIIGPERIRQIMYEIYLNYAKTVGDSETFDAAFNTVPVRLENFDSPPNVGDVIFKDNARFLDEGIRQFTDICMRKLNIKETEREKVRNYITENSKQKIGNAYTKEDYDKDVRLEITSGVSYMYTRNTDFINYCLMKDADGKPIRKRIFNVDDEGNEYTDEDIQAFFNANPIDEFALDFTYVPETYEDVVSRLRGYINEEDFEALEIFNNLVAAIEIALDNFDQGYDPSLISQYYLYGDIELIPMIAKNYWKTIYEDECPINLQVVKGNPLIYLNDVGEGSVFNISSNNIKENWGKYVDRVYPEMIFTMKKKDFLLGTPDQQIAFIRDELKNYPNRRVLSQAEILDKMKRQPGFRNDDYSNDYKALYNDKDNYDEETTIITPENLPSIIELLSYYSPSNICGELIAMANKTPQYMINRKIELEKAGVLFTASSEQYSKLIENFRTKKTTPELLENISKFIFGTSSQYKIEEVNMNIDLDKIASSIYGEFKSEYQFDLPLIPYNREEKEWIRRHNEKIQAIAFQESDENRKGEILRELMDDEYFTPTFEAWDDGGDDKVKISNHEKYLQHKVIVPLSLRDNDGELISLLSQKFAPFRKNNYPTHKLGIYRRKTDGVIALNSKTFTSEFASKEDAFRAGRFLEIFPLDESKPLIGDNVVKIIKDKKNRDQNVVKTISKFYTNSRAAEYFYPLINVDEQLYKIEKGLNANNIQRNREVTNLASNVNVSKTFNNGGNWRSAIGNQTNVSQGASRDVSRDYSDRRQFSDRRGPSRTSDNRSGGMDSVRYNRSDNVVERNSGGYRNNYRNAQTNRVQPEKVVRAQPVSTQYGDYIRYGDKVLYMGKVYLDDAQFQRALAENRFDRLFDVNARDTKTTKMNIKRSLDQMEKKSRDRKYNNEQRPREQRVAPEKAYASYNRLTKPGENEWSKPLDLTRNKWYTTHNTQKFAGTNNTYVKVLDNNGGSRYNKTPHFRRRDSNRDGRSYYQNDRRQNQSNRYQSNRGQSNRYDTRTQNSYRGQSNRYDTRTQRSQPSRPSPKQATPVVQTEISRDLDNAGADLVEVTQEIANKFTEEDVYDPVEVKADVVLDDEEYDF